MSPPQKLKNCVWLLQPRALLHPSSFLGKWLDFFLDFFSLESLLDFGSWAWVSSSDAILDCWKLLLIPGCPRNAEKLTKAPLSLDSMKSLDLPPDPQHFTNSMKVAKRKSLSLKCLFVFLNILTMSVIRRSETADERHDTCSLSLNLLGYIINQVKRHSTWHKSCRMIYVMTDFLTMQFLKRESGQS